MPQNKSNRNGSFKELPVVSSFSIFSSCCELLPSLCDDYVPRITAIGFYFYCVLYGLRSLCLSVQPLACKGSPHQIISSLSLTMSVLQSIKKMMKKEDIGKHKDQIPKTPPPISSSDVILTWRTVQSGLVASTPPLSLNTTNSPNTDDENDVSNEFHHPVDMTSSKIGTDNGIMPTKLFGEMSELMSALSESQAQNEQKDTVIASLHAQLASLKAETDKMGAVEKATSEMAKAAMTSLSEQVSELADAKQSVRDKNDLLKSLQTKLLKLNMVTEKANVSLAEKVNDLEKATAEIENLQNIVTKYKKKSNC